MKLEKKMKESKGFDLVGNIKINGISKKTNMRFRSVKDFESYIEKIDDHYDGDEVIFTGDSIEYDVPEFKPVKRSNYGKGTNYLADIEEFHGDKCFIPSGNNCFLKCINYLTSKDYKNEYFEFIRNEDRRKNVMTSARVQPFVTKHGIDVGIFNGTQILPKSVKERRKCLYLYKNQFCVIWGDSLKKAVKKSSLILNILIIELIN